MMFDPASFLSQTTTEVNDTKKVPCPVGDYVAVASKVVARPWQSKDGLKSGMALDITWDIDDANVLALLDREKVTVRQGIMLDLLDNGMLDMGKGKNVALGRVRAALGLNVPGQAFAPSMIEGRTGRVKIGHRADGEDIFDEVKAVAAL